MMIGFTYILDYLMKGLIQLRVLSLETPKIELFIMHQQQM